MRLPTASRLGTSWQKIPRFLFRQENLQLNRLEDLGVELVLLIATLSFVLFNTKVHIVCLRTPALTNGQYCLIHFSLCHVALPLSACIKSHSRLLEAGFHISFAGRSVVGCLQQRNYISEIISNT